MAPHSGTLAWKIPWTEEPGLTLCDPIDCTPQAPLFMEFSRQEYWSRWSLPSLGDRPHPGIKSMSPA